MNNRGPKQEPVFWIGLFASLLMFGLNQLADAGFDVDAVVTLVGPVLSALVGRRFVTPVAAGSDVDV